MTITEFESVCGECLIAPQVALESEEVIEGLKNNVTPDEMREILKREF